MNFLGMGPLELMVILVLALIVFGPGKLPEIAGQVGRVVRDIRRATTDLSSEFNRTLNLELEERRQADGSTTLTDPSTSVEPVATTTATATEPPLASTTSATWEEPWKPEPTTSAVATTSAARAWTVEPPYGPAVARGSENGALPSAPTSKDASDLLPPY